MQFKVTTQPVSEPITLAEAKAHLRVDFTDDDALIGALITAARQYCEDILGRALMAQTLEAVLDEEPGDVIQLPRPPLIDVRSIKFYDVDNVATLVDPTEYLMDTHSEPGRIVLADEGEWPDVDLRPGNAVVIEFDAGYGDDGEEDVPAKFKQAMLLLIGHWYTHREEVSVGAGTAMQIPFAAQALLQADRVMPV